MPYQARSVPLSPEVPVIGIITAKATRAEVQKTLVVHLTNRAYELYGQPAQNIQLGAKCAAAASAFDVGCDAIEFDDTRYEIIKTETGS